MIFPPVRISQLTRDLDQKRAAFESSREDLGKEVRRKLHPLNILKDHPQLWVGTAMSLVSAGSLGKFLGFFSNGREEDGTNGRKKSGNFLTGLLRFGARTAVKGVAPIALNTAKFALKSAFRAFRHRRTNGDSA
jgi:hypothetical protein